MVSIVDAGDDSVGLIANIISIDIVKGKVYTCPTLKPAKGIERENSEGKVEYYLDISKADHIFTYLLKDKQIWLLDGHKIPPP